MAMPEYWNTKQVCEYLTKHGTVQMKPNNLAQITLRMKRGHELAGHKSDRCDCLLVDHKGNKTNWYRADKVMNYDLYRKGAPSLIGQVLANARKADKVKTAKRKTKGRPTTKIGR